MTTWVARNRFHGSTVPRFHGFVCRYQAAVVTVGTGPWNLWNGTLESSADDALDRLLQNNRAWAADRVERDPNSSPAS